LTISPELPERTGVFIESADTRSNKNAGPLGQLGRDRQCRLLHRVIGGSDGVVDECIHLLDVLFFKPAEWIEILNFGGDPGGKLGGIKTGNRRDAAASLTETFPRLLPPRTQRSNQPHAGDHNSS